MSQNLNGPIFDKIHRDGMGYVWEISDEATVAAAGGKVKRGEGLEYIKGADATELAANMGVDAAALAETDDAIAVLPQPFVTTAMMQNDKLRIALSLTDEWDKLDNGSTLVTGVTIIRTDVLEENPAAVEKFLEEYEASINYTETNAEDAAKLIAQYEIVPKEPIALKALPGCNIHFIKGEEMKEKASGYLQVLFDADPKSVGGTLPDDAFYYTE